ncbi:MAG: Crp/Fnr family transcriptional regulator [Caulobacteraceae bacterium]
MGIKGAIAINTATYAKPVCSIYRNALYSFFSGKGTIIVFKKKSIIEYGGKPVKHVYLIRKGVVQQYFLDQDGNVKTLLILTKGDLFGEITLFQGDKDLVITQAHGDVEVEKIPADLFTSLLEENPQIYYHISLMLSNKARIFMAQVKDSSFCDSAHKLKNLLVRLSIQHGEAVNGGVKIIHRFTHEDLARMISSTRSTVTKKMKILENEGFIEIINHHIIVKTNDKSI